MIGAEGGEDSCGSTGQGSLLGTPAESEAAWSGNQQPNLDNIIILEEVLEDLVALHKHSYDYGIQLRFLLRDWMQKEQGTKRKVIEQPFFSYDSSCNFIEIAYCFVNHPVFIVIISQHFIKTSKVVLLFISLLKIRNDLCF